MLKALMERRESLKAGLQVILDKAKTENRAMSDEENTEFERIEGEIKNIDRTIAAEERARNIPAPAANNNGNGAGGNDDPTVEQMEERAFADFIYNRVSENRAEGTAMTQGNNGGIVPTTIANRIIAEVRDMVPFLDLAEVVNTNGKFSIPVYTEDGTNAVSAAYIDENVELADNVGKFITVDLTGFVIGALALVSEKLKDNADVDVVGFVVTRVAEGIAEMLEKEFVVGTDGKITGILSAKKVINASSATAITYDDLVNLKHSLKQRFRRKACFIMNPSTYTAICKLKDENGLPYFKESEYKILDLPVIESDSMPEIATGNKVISCANLSGYTIKATKKIEVKILREKFATKHMLGILGFAEYDAKISNEKKFATLQMA